MGCRDFFNLHLPPRHKSYRHTPDHLMETLRPALATLRLAAPRRAYRPLYQCLHTSAARHATPLPHASVPGPPPATPTPHPSDPLERVARKKRQAEMVKKAQEVRTESVPSNKPKALLRKRFWKDSIVKETDGVSCELRLLCCSADRRQRACKSSSTADPSEPPPRTSSPSLPRSTSSPRPLPSSGTSC